MYTLNFRSVGIECVEVWGYCGVRLLGDQNSGVPFLSLRKDCCSMGLAFSRDVPTMSPLQVGVYELTGSGCNVGEAPTNLALCACDVRITLGIQVYK